MQLCIHFEIHIEIIIYRGLSPLLLKVRGGLKPPWFLRSCHKPLSMQSPFRGSLTTGHPRLHLHSPSHFATFHFLHLSNIPPRHLDRYFEHRRYLTSVAFIRCMENQLGKSFYQLLLQAKSPIARCIAVLNLRNRSDKFRFNFLHVVNLFVVN